jgi:hypothetical protein
LLVLLFATAATIIVGAVFAAAHHDREVLGFTLPLLFLPVGLGVAFGYCVGRLLERARRTR